MIIIKFSFSFSLFLAPNVFRPIVEIQQESILRSENASSFNNKVQRRKVSDSSAESNTNKFIGSPDDVPSTRIETGLNVSRSAFSMVSTFSEQTPTGLPKLSHRPQPSFSQEVNHILKIVYVRLKILIL